MQYRIVITGAAGFLGSHLCDRFLNGGYSVIGIDNFLTGSRTNIRHLQHHDAFTFVEHDITQPIDIDGEIVGVLHFASPASPIDYLRYPIATMLAGSVGTQHALEIARIKNARFLLASTSEIYGDPAVHPQREEYWGNVNSVGPRSVYDEAKRFSEALTMAYHREWKLDTRIVRIFNTYGPRMRPHDGRVVSNFIVQALTGKPITVYGDGSQTRSLCYVSDEVEGIYRLFTSGDAKPMNIGNPNECTIRALAELVRELTNNPVPIQYAALPEDDPKIRCPDITRAETTIGWKPIVNLREGLGSTIMYFEKALSNNATSADSSINALY